MLHKFLQGRAALRAQVAAKRLYKALVCSAAGATTALLNAARNILCLYLGLYNNAYETLIVTTTFSLVCI